MGITSATRSRRPAQHLLRTVVAASALVFSLALAVTSHAQDTKRMDQVVRSFVDSKQFMGTVLVARGDQIVFDKAYGSASLELQVANTPATKFRLGSITKQFTGAAILLLEERGKLNLDDPIKKHYPDAPAAWDAVTLRHLLTHTSGIMNFTNLPDYNKFKHHPLQPLDAIAMFRDKPLEFTPGERMSYSNSGYIVLGYVIEKVSGMSYGEFVQANIFTPLGMKDSGYDSNPTIIERRAAGYERKGEALVNADFIHMTVPNAAGGLYSTTGDLLRWQHGLYGGKLLSAASLKKMTTPFKDNYAFGVGVEDKNGRTVYAHGGGIDGFTTQMNYFPKEQLTVVALSNVASGAAAAIAGNLSAIAHGEAVKLISERSEISVPREVLQRYVGTYSLGPQMNFMITLEGSQLMGQVSGQMRFPAFAESTSRFFFKVVDAQIDFVEEQGKVTHLVLHQGGRDMKAARTSDTVASRKEIALPADKLAAYVGTYALRPGLDLVVTVEGSQLILNPTGQGTDPLYAESPDLFFSKRVDATIQFHRDAQGKVTHLTLNQGQFKGDAPRKTGP